jgi:hypothetical protein
MAKGKHHSIISSMLTCRACRALASSKPADKAKCAARLHDEHHSRSKGSINHGRIGAGLTLTLHMAVSRAKGRVLGEMKPELRAKAFKN